jgi:hypothetical protein
MGCWLIVAILAGLPTIAQAQSSMVERLSKRFDVPFVTLSPNGKRIATAITFGMDNQLFILETNTLEAIAFRFRLKAVDEVVWYDDERLLAVAQDAMDVTQIFEVDLANDKSRQLTKFSRETSAENASIHLHPPFSHVNATVQFTRAIYRRGTTLYQLDVPKSALTTVAHLAHPNDAVIPIKRATFSLLETWQGERYGLRYSNAAPAAAAPYQGSMWDKLQMRALAVAPDTNDVYVSINQQGLLVVRRWNSITGQLGPVLHADPGYDVDAKPVILPYSGEVIGVEYQRDRPAVHYFDREFERLMAKLALNFPGRYYSIVSASTDNDKLVILSRSDTMPGE